MVLLEKLTGLTARSILNFIQKDSTKACTGWFIKKCMDKSFGDPEYLKQLKIMNEISREFEQIKPDTSHKSIIKTKWEHLNTRIFQAEMDICHKFKLMKTIMSNKNSIERSNEALLLRNGILDTNGGILSNLAVIHQVLVGQTATNPTEKGLLEIRSNEIYVNMKTNPMSAKTYKYHVDKYMTQAALLQFKGFILFTGANTHPSFCSHQFELFAKNLEYQIETMEKTVPPYITYLLHPEEKHVFVLRSVLDGEPFVRRREPGKGLINEFFGRNIEEGKWNFEKSLSFDNDGSLNIFGHSLLNGQRYYMKVSETNKANCVSVKECATSFLVIPLHFENQQMKILICESKSKRFIGNNLTFVDGDDSREFILSFGCV